MINMNENLSPLSSVKHKFTGLLYQEATMYLNSVLQSLYMTPEFRQKVYMWLYDEQKHGDKKDSIPFNLQLLFAKLQISKTPYVETMALRDSLGNNPSDFRQHGVQGLYRLLFNSIEESVRGTENENMIFSLYEGSISHYIKCLNCSYQSHKTDTFLDLSLTIRNDLDKVYNDTVEKALSNFIKPKKLCGNSKYSCELCGSKQEALEESKFEKLPHLLILPLKRFDINYSTFQTVKFNDEMAFPEILNLNKYMKDYSETEETATVNEVAYTENKDLFNYMPADLDWRELECIFNNYNDQPLCDDLDKQPLIIDPIAKKKFMETLIIQSKRQQQQKIEEYLTQGEFVYELFSIVIHSGYVMDDYYYAYIKDFEDSCWYNFDDNIITPLDPRDIRNAFGGIINTDCNSSSSASACLLMYRKVNSENILRVSEAEVPKYIKDELETILEQDCINDSEIDEEYKKLTLKVFYQKKEKTLIIKKNQLLQKLKKQAIEEFKLHHHRFQDLRIRGYSPYHDILQEIYEEDAKLEEQAIWNYKNLAIEIKKPGIEWPSYNSNFISVRVHLWDSFFSEYAQIIDETDKLSRIFVVNKRNSVRDMLRIFQEAFGIPIDKMIVFTKRYLGGPYILERIKTAYSKDLSLAHTQIFEGTIIYIEEMQEKTRPSRWQLLFNRKSQVFTLKFNYPDFNSQHASYTKYNLSVILDRSATLDNLRSKISRKINIPSDELIMKRGGKHCQELKDMGSTLVQANFVNDLTIHIERGRPAEPNEFRIRFSIASLAKPQDGGMCCFTFVDLFELLVNSKIIISDLKRILAEKIIEMFPSMEVESSLMRLRERNLSLLSRVFKENELFEQCRLYDSKEISIQLLPEYFRVLEDEELIVVVKRFWPSTWKTSEAREIVINKFRTFNDFGEILSEEFGIPRENLEVAKMEFYYKYAIEDLMKNPFYRTIGNHNKLGQEPWYLKINSNLMFVKDTEEIMREPTDSEKENFSKIPRENNY